jgi:hypothetical protein
MANDHPEAPKPLGCHLSEETIENNKKLLSKESLVNADLMLASAYKFDSGWILG